MSLREALPANHLARFVVDVVAELDHRRYGLQVTNLGLQVLTYQSPLAFILHDEKNPLAGLYVHAVFDNYLSRIHLLSFT